MNWQIRPSKRVPSAGREDEVGSGSDCSLQISDRLLAVLHGYKTLRYLTILKCQNRIFFVDLNLNQKAACPIDLYVWPKVRRLRTAHGSPTE
jgi:hypothetical protein